MPPFSFPSDPDVHTHDGSGTPPPPPRRRDLRSADDAPVATRSAATPLLSVLVGTVIIALGLTLLWGLSQRDATELGGQAGVPATGTLTDPQTLADDEPPADPGAADAAAGNATPAVGDADDDGANGVVPDVTDDVEALAMVVDTDDLARALAQLDSVAQTSTCSSMYADAGIFHGYAATAAATGAWPDLVSARRPAVTLDALAEHCDEQYAERLTRYIVNDPQTDELLRYTLQEHLAELPQHHPAPTDALELEMFHAGGGTIGCTLTDDGVGCSVSNVAFDDLPACLEPGDTTFSVALFSDEVFPCAGTITGGATALPNGASTAIGDYACTAVGDGVRCWHTVSGTTFELSATAVTMP